MELCPHRVVVVQRSAPWPKIHVKCHLSPTKATAQLLKAVVDGGELRTHAHSTLFPHAMSLHTWALAPWPLHPHVRGIRFVFLPGSLNGPSSPGLAQNSSSTVFTTVLLHICFLIMLILFSFACNWPLTVSGFQLLYGRIRLLLKYNATMGQKRKRKLTRKKG